MRKSVIFLASLLMITGSAYSGMSYIRTGAGFIVSLVGPDGRLHPTFGWGGLMDLGFSLGNAGELHFFPNIEFWISGDERPGVDETCFEMAINGDVRYYFPVPKRITVRPYGGMGLAAVYEYQNLEYLNGTDRDYTDMGVAVNFMGGIDIPFTSSITGFTEMKGKVGEGNEVIKFTFGMKFLF